MSIRGMFLIVGLAIAFVFLLVGCEPQKDEAKGKNGCEVKINIDVSGRKARMP